MFARMYHFALGSLVFTALSVCVCFTHGPVLRVQSRRAQSRQTALAEDSDSIRASGQQQVLHTCVARALEQAAA